MLTLTQKSKIRLMLGFPDAFRYKNTRLEGMFDNISPEADDQLAALLANVEKVETALLDTGIDGAGIKRVDEIWFDNGMRRSSEIRKMGRMYVARISIILGVPIYSDVFGTYGFLGDKFSGPRQGGGFFNLS